MALTPARSVVLVNGLPGSGKSTLAGQLAAALALPLLSKDAVKETLLDELGLTDQDESRRLGRAAGEVIWRILADCPQGAVIDSWMVTDLRPVVSRGLRSAQCARMVELWCRAPDEMMRRRYAERSPLRHAGHFDHLMQQTWEQWLQSGEPLGLGPVVDVDTTVPVEVGALVDQIRRVLGH